MDAVFGRLYALKLLTLVKVYRYVRQNVIRRSPRFCSPNKKCLPVLGPAGEVVDKTI